VAEIYFELRTVEFSFASSENSLITICAVGRIASKSGINIFSACLTISHHEMNRNVRVPSGAIQPFVAKSTAALLNATLQKEYFIIIHCYLYGINDIDRKKRHKL
jgi:hypothetical protein